MKIEKSYIGMQKHQKTNDFGTKQQKDGWNHDSLLLDEISNTEISSCCALVAEDSDDGSFSSGNNNNNQVNNSSRILIGDAIIKLGHGRFQRQLIFVVGLCLASDALEVTLLAYLSAVLRYEWNLSSLETATITSSVFAGQLLGTLILGPLGDRYGRRPIILVSSVMISTFGCLTATATHFTSLVVIRTILGFGIGGFVVPFDILAEFLSSEVRGKYLLAVEYFWTFGTLLVSVVASVTIGGRDDSSSGWQTFVIACAMPSILAAFFAYWWIPESPQWLATQGRSAEAFQILRHAASVNGKNPLLLFPRNLETLSFDSKFSDDGDTDAGNDSSIKNISSSGYVSCMGLFQPKWRRLTLLLWSASFGMAFGYYGVILLITRVFQGNNPSNQDEPLFNFHSILISSSAEIVGLTVSILIVESVGRIKPQAAFFFLGGVFSFILSLSASSGSSVIFLTAISFCLKVVEMGSSTLLWVTTAEALPTEIRTTGHSAANAMARIGGFLCPFLVQENTPLWFIGFTMLLLHTISAFCVLGLPETGLQKFLSPVYHDIHSIMI